MAFAKRDLSGLAVEYLFLDAIYESLREQAGLKGGVLVASSTGSNGRKVLLHLALGIKESYARCIKLVFATLWRASQRWQGVKMSEVERQQLGLLRRELGLVPDGTSNVVGLKTGRLAA